MKFAELEKLNEDVAFAIEVGEQTYLAEILLKEVKRLRRIILEANSLDDARAGLEQ